MSHLQEQLEQRPQVHSDARANTQEADTRQSLFESAYGVGGGVGHLMKDGMNKLERSNNGSKNEQDCVTELDFGADPFADKSAKNRQILSTDKQYRNTQELQKSPPPRELEINNPWVRREDGRGLMPRDQHSAPTQTRNRIWS